MVYAELTDRGSTVILVPPPAYTEKKQCYNSRRPSIYTGGYKRRSTIEGLRYMDKYNIIFPSL